MLQPVDRAFGKYGAGSHDDDRIAKQGDEIHIVLNDEKRVAEFPVEAGNVGGEVSKQGLVDAGGDLVEQHDAGLGHHGATEFEQFLLAAG